MKPSDPAPQPLDQVHLLASIVESSDDAIASKTLQGVLTSWNKAAEDLFGYSAEEAIGQSVRILIPADRQYEEDMILEKIQRGQRIEHYETVRVRKDGSHVEVAVTISPVRDAQGRIIGASKIVRSIAERKRIEAERAQLLELERAARAEAESLWKLTSALSSNLDLESVIQKATDTAREVTKAEFAAFFYNEMTSAGEAYLLFTLSGAPRASFERFGMPRNTPLFEPTFSGKGVTRIDDVLADPRYGTMGPHFGMPKGHLPVRSYLAVPVRSRDGEVIGGLFFGHSDVGVFDEQCERLAAGIAAQAAVCMDNARLYEKANKEIEERRAAEDRERSARIDAERSSRLKEEFLATLSHEIRTPLNAIVGWAQILTKLPVQDETLTTGLSAIDRNARIQAHLISDMLDMSRIVSGKMRLEVQPVDLPTVIQAAHDSILPAAQAKSIKILKVIEPVTDPLIGDPARIQQVVWNLLSNAVKFTPKGGRIEIVLARVNSHVEIIVSDTGIGIKPEFLPYVFERFRQQDSSAARMHGGLGLGLAIVKQLVEMHGGTIQVASEGDNKGATFTVGLPISLIHAASLEGGRSHPRTISPPTSEHEPPNLDRVRVLVVDDDVDGGELVERVLADRGARVVLARSAEEALKIIELQTFDVIVSDIGMPLMDGYRFMRTVRAKGIRWPAAALTAFARSEDRTRALHAGYQTHVVKPVEASELLALVASLAQISRDDTKTT